MRARTFQLDVTGVPNDNVDNRYVRRQRQRSRSGPSGPWLFAYPVRGLRMSRDTVCP